MKYFQFLLICLLLSSCTQRNLFGHGPSLYQRQIQIDSEQPNAPYFIGRRYYVEHTRFWGYVRPTQTPWSSAKLVTMNEDLKLTPDRRTEGVKGGHGYDANYEYRLYGKFTGQKVYDPNTNQFIEEFQLTDYALIDDDPGWLFSPAEVYDRKRITIRNR